MFDYYAPFSPVDISILSRAEGLSKIESLLGGRARVMVMIEEFLLDALALREWAGRVAEGGGLLFTQVPANPSVDAVAGALSALEGRAADAIVAIGGGSCIDLAKAVSALRALLPEACVSSESVRGAIEEKRYLTPHEFIDIIAVPTTAGTGSEVTKWATIWDPERQAKRSVDCTSAFPKAAVIIPEFTQKMPPKLTLSTGLDAMAHAMEAFWANARTPLSQALALSAVRGVIGALPAALAEPDSPDRRRDMCVCSLTAGLAFSITRTTACHSISYPLTMLFGIPHGFAAAVTLLEVMRRNAECVKEIEGMYALFGGADAARGWFERVARDIQPLNLSAFGVHREEIPGIARLAFTQGRMDNNPVGFTIEDVCDILYACY